jgi:predicted O-methyltransferase YrrM
MEQLEPLNPKDLSKNTGIQSFISNRSRVETVLLPIRDGLTVSRVLLV